MIEVKKLSISTFTSKGIGIYTVLLTFKKPFKVSRKSAIAQKQIAKKLKKMDTESIKYPKYVVEYDGYSFLYENKKEK
jgi:hypothetical protein